MAANSTADDVVFRTMDTASPEQLRRYITEGTAYFKSHLVPTMVHLLELGRDAAFGAGVDRYTHSLQTATRAYRDNARLDMVVGALFHDVADSFAISNHAAVAADMLRKYVDAETAWVIEHHTIFQGFHYWDKIGQDPDARDRWLGHPFYDATAAFCADWDQVSFDERYPTEPIEFFLPAVDELFSRPVDGLTMATEP